MDVSDNVLYASQLMDITPPPPPPPISIDDLMNSVQMIAQKEADDKAALEAIGDVTVDQLRAKLVDWAMAKFPNNYEVHKVVIIPPAKCSDGVTRQLAEYIEFCSGKPFNDFVDLLRQKVVGITLGFANMGSHIAILASKD